jgi:hypothetical protein
MRDIVFSGLSLGRNVQVNKGSSPVGVTLDRTDGAQWRLW